MRKRSGGSPVSLFSFQDIITGLCGLLILFVLIMIIDLVVRRDAPDETLPDSREQIEQVEAETEALRKELARIAQELAEARRKRSLAVSDEQLAKSEEVLSGKDRELANLLAEVKALETRLEKARDANEKSRKRLQEMELAKRNLEDSLAKLKRRNGITLIPERGNLKSPVYVVLGRDKAQVCAPLDKNDRMVEVATRNGRFNDALEKALKRYDPSTHTVVVLVRPSGVEWMDLAVYAAKGLRFAVGRDPLEEDVELSFGDGEGDES